MVMVMVGCMCACVHGGETCLLRFWLHNTFDRSSLDRNTESRGRHRIR